MTRRERCEACGTPAPSEARARKVGESRGGHVGHANSERRLWFCASHLKDAAVREEIVREAFGKLMDEERKGFKPRSKAEAKAMERRDNQRAGYGTPGAAKRGAA